MSRSRAQVSRLAGSRDVEGLTAYLGPLDDADVRARLALIAIGEDAVPVLLSLALEEAAPASDTPSDRVDAAHTVLVQIGEPTLRAATQVVRKSDDRRVVAAAAALLYRTALELGVTVSDDVKAEVESKTGTDWATASGEGWTPSCAGDCPV